MITLTIFTVIVWLAIGAWVTAKIAYRIGDKYRWCGACIQYILLLLWLFIPAALIVDLVMLGVFK